jgi:hypothetical protein
MILRHRFPVMMLSAPLKTGIQMPLPVAAGGYRELDRPRVVPIRNRRKTIAIKSNAFAARLLRFLGLRQPRTNASPKTAAAIKRAQAMTAITPQEYLF